MELFFFPFLFPALKYGIPSFMHIAYSYGDPKRKESGAEALQVLLQSWPEAS